MIDYFFFFVCRNLILVNEFGEWCFYTAICRNRRATRRSRIFVLVKLMCLLL